MAKSGPIVIIEDDEDDQEIVSYVIENFNLKNTVVFLENCDDAWKYLKSTLEQPFIILCDINLPKLNGLDFKKQIDDDCELRRKSIPFVFFSTTANRQTVTKAFTETAVQGFFQKSHSMDELRYQLKLILDYWKHSKHPNAEFGNLG